MTTEVKCKRVYDDAAEDDGYRVLADRLWPRGLSKEAVDEDEWAKDVAPSAELRRWFHGGDRDFAEFRRRYEAELDSSDALSELAARCRRHKTVTLLYAAKDQHKNHTGVLRDVLLTAMAR